MLVVEDDRDMVAALRRNLELDGFDVAVAYDGPSGLAAMRDAAPQLVILDVMLPGMSGTDVLARARSAGFRAPVLLLTARRQERDKIRGFWHGADDYVTKPFSLAELLARITVLIRRTEQVGLPPVDDTSWVRCCGPITIDVVRRGARYRERSLTLSPKAYDLLLALVSRCGGVATRRELLREVWGYAPSVSSRTLDTHIAELRRQIETDPSRPRFIRTQWRIGYLLDPAAIGSPTGPPDQV